VIWFLLAFIGAFTNAAYNVGVKFMVRNTDPLVLAACTYVAAGLLLFAASTTAGLPAIGPSFLSAVLVTGTLNVVATVLYFRAVRTTDISLCIPMLSFTPVFLVASSALILGESPSSAGIAGIGLVVIGSYVINITGRCRTLTGPVRAMLGNRGVMSLFLVAFIYGISANYDKIAVVSSDPYFASGTVFCFVGGVLFSVRCLQERRLPAIPARTILAFAGIGAVLAVEAAAVNLAYTMAIVPYVISIKRLAIVMTVLFGWLIFKEQEQVQRLAGASIMVLGACCILLFG